MGQGERPMLVQEARTTKIPVEWGLRSDKAECRPEHSPFSQDVKILLLIVLKLFCHRHRDECRGRDQVPPLEDEVRDSS